MRPVSSIEERALSGARLARSVALDSAPLSFLDTWRCSSDDVFEPKLSFHCLLTPAYKSSFSINHHHYNVLSFAGFEMSIMPSFDINRAIWKISESGNRITMGLFYKWKKTLRSSRDGKAFDFIIHDTTELNKGYGSEAAPYLRIAKFPYYGGTRPPYTSEDGKTFNSDKWSCGSIPIFWSTYRGNCETRQSWGDFLLFFFCARTASFRVERKLPWVSLFVLNGLQ